MNHRLTVIERAYQLAETGQCFSMSDIKARLKAEGYGDANTQLQGRVMSTALRKLWEAARAERQGASGA